MGLSRPFSYPNNLPYGTPRNPAKPKLCGLGFSPFARRYSGNHCCFLFLRVLRCFSSPGLPPYAYGFSVRYCPITSSGFPHSEIPGSQPAYGSPRHIGVCPVLHRHLAPRHPPCALRSLTLRYASKDCFRCLVSQSIMLSSYQGTRECQSLLTQSQTIRRKPHDLPLSDPVLIPQD